MCGEVEPRGAHGPRLADPEGAVSVALASESARTSGEAAWRRSGDCGVRLGARTPALRAPCRSDDRANDRGRARSGAAVLQRGAADPVIRDGDRRCVVGLSDPGQREREADGGCVCRIGVDRITGVAVLRRAFAALQLLDERAVGVLVIGMAGDQPRDDGALGLGDELADLLDERVRRPLRHRRERPHPEHEQGVREQGEQA